MKPKMFNNQNTLLKRHILYKVQSTIKPGDYTEHLFITPDQFNFHLLDMLIIKINSQRDSKTSFFFFKATTYELLNLNVPKSWG